MIAEAGNTMPAVKWPIEDLKSFALARCIDIFEDYDESEIKGESLSIRSAWEVGRDAVAARDKS